MINRFLMVHSVYQYRNSEVRYSDHITIKTNLVEENYSQREYVLYYIIIIIMMLRLYTLIVYFDFVAGCR